MATIYISSTFSDLEAHRQAVYHVLRQLGHDVRAMEDYVAADDRPVDKCLTDVKACDLYVGIFARRYGFIPPHDNPDNLSITELEYHAAGKSGKDRLVFLLAEDAEWPSQQFDAITGEADQGQRIDTLRQDLAQNHLRSAFTTPEDLARTVSVAVTKWEQHQAPPKPQPTASSQPDSNVRNRQIMLDKVHTIWIKGFLEQSLDQEARLTLGLTETPESVERPMDILVQRPGEAERPLPPGDPIIKEYDAMSGALLILGAPGSGKTTLLLELLRDLLERAQDDAAHRIPVVFPLTTWAETRSPLSEWLVDELRKRYEVPSRLASAWVENEQIIPLLDGLDEVAGEHRAACVDAINAFRQVEDHWLLPLVVCSRTADYEAVGKRLRLPSAVRIEPLTREQVRRHLARGGPRFEAIRQVLENDPELWELLDTPLMLSIFTLAYADQPKAVQQSQGDLEQRRRQVFAAYVDQMFQRRGAEAPYTPEQTRHWLAWLATQMTRESLTVFYIEWLQPDWLPNQHQQWLLRAGKNLFLGLLGGLLKGGHTCLQHFLLRWMLTRNGNMPWRCADFLDYAAERILLRKVGGGYVFIHRYLLDYFATLNSVDGAQDANTSTGG